MDIKYIGTDQIYPYENNPKTNEHSIGIVKDSILEFGFKVPIIIDKNNIIIAGHTRHAAAIELGMKEVPTLKAEDLTEEQVKAFRIIDNKTQEQSSWDFAKLDQELEKIKEIDMEQFGFANLIKQEAGADLVMPDFDDSLFEEAERLFTTFTMTLTLEEEQTIRNYFDQVYETGKRPEENLVEFLEKEFLQ